MLDPDILRRISPSGSEDALQNFNKELLARMINPAVFQRMSEGQAGLPHEQKYVGVDMLRDLNRGLFSELDQKRPIVSLYRRELQRAYLRVLVNPAKGEEEQRVPGVATDQPSLFDLDSESSRGRFLEQVQRNESSSIARPAEDKRPAPNEPSEFRGAVRAGMQDLASRIKAAQKRVKDDETSLHLADVLTELERGR